MDAKLAPQRVTIVRDFTDLLAERVDAVMLVPALDHLAVDLDGQRVAAGGPSDGAAFQVILPEKGFELMRMSLALEIPEPDFGAVGEEHERNTELGGVWRLRDRVQALAPPGGGRPRCGPAMAE